VTKIGEKEDSVTHVLQHLDRVSDRVEEAYRIVLDYQQQDPEASLSAALDVCQVAASQLSDAMFHLHHLERKERTT